MSKKRTATVVRCTCGQSNAYMDKPNGGTTNAAKTLIGIFRHFHEQHGGTVTATTEEQP
jgi:hypothetical protein